MNQPLLGDESAAHRRLTSTIGDQPTGECLCSCGQMYHGARRVTRGTRYVCIAFIDEMQIAASPRLAR